MGSWGVAVFSDDFTADVRGDWREALMGGAETDEATAMLLEKYRPGLDDESVGLFWLALAVAQWETGRLVSEARDRAVAWIDDGGDLDVWREASEGAARQRGRVLERVRERLVGPQPKAKRPRRKRQLDVRFELGDVVLLRHPTNGGERLVVVVGQLEPEAFRYEPERVGPVVEFLDWKGDVVPDDAELAALSSRMVDVQWGGHPDETVKVLQASVGTATKDEAFGSQLGEVVARVSRPVSAPDESEIHKLDCPAIRLRTSWPLLAASIGSDEIDQCAIDRFGHLLFLDEWGATLRSEPARADRYVFLSTLAGCLERLAPVGVVATPAPGGLWIRVGANRRFVGVQFEAPLEALAYAALVALQEAASEATAAPWPAAASTASRDPHAEVRVNEHGQRWLHSWYGDGDSPLIELPALLVDPLGER